MAENQLRIVLKWDKGTKLYIYTVTSKGLPQGTNLKMNFVPCLKLLKF
jgi:hypothetical protein